MIKVKPNTCDVTVVVAVYEENIDWIKNIKHNTIIYNKGSRHLEESEKAKVIPLQNNGRESQTYLHHIVENYDNLSDMTIFCQGGPFDHSPEFIRIANCNSIAKMNAISKKIDDRDWPNDDHYCGIGHYFVYDLIKLASDDWDLKFKIPYILIGLDVMYPRCIPMRFMKALWGANFAVSKQNIHRFSKAQYQKLLDYHQEFWSFPWSMEIIWHHIFCELDAPKEKF
jgi:hypothetical protein